MTQRALTSRLPVVLALGLTLVLASTVAAYTRPTTSPPTSVDLLVNQGISNSVVVRLVNMTPYTVEFVESSLADQTNTDRGTHKSLMFAPVGVPGSYNGKGLALPGLNGAWSKNENDYDVFTPSSSGQTTHSYNMLFSWDDQGGTVTDSHVTWVVKNVKGWTDNQGARRTGDAKIGLWFHRNKPSNSLRSEGLEEVCKILTVFLDTIGLMLDPENPIAWWDELVAVKELASSDFEEENSSATGTKMWVASYAYPDPGSACDIAGPQCTPFSIASDVGSDEEGATTDGIATRWASGDDAGGYVGPYIEVTTHILRGKDQTGTGWNGGLPIVIVVLWTQDFFQAALTAYNGTALKACPEGAHLHSLLAGRNRQKFFEFAHLFSTLNPEQRKAYYEIGTELRKHHPISTEQKALLVAMARALEHGHQTLGGRPQHERKEGPSHVH